MALWSRVKNFKQGYSQGAEEYIERRELRRARRAAETTASLRGYQRSRERWNYLKSWIHSRREERQPQQAPPQPQQTYPRERKSRRLGLLVLILFMLFLFVSLGCPFIPILSGTCDVWVSKAQAAVGRQLTTIKEYFSKEVVSLAKYGEWTSPTVVSEKPTEKRGAIISKFEPGLKFFNENEDDITLIGSIDVKNMPNDIKLDITCSAESYNDPVEIELVAENQKSKGGISTIVKGSKEGITQQVQVRCIIPKGGLTVENKEKTITGKEKVRAGKKVTLNVDYDIIATTILDLYVANQEQRARYGFGTPLFLINNREDIIRSNLWKGDGEIKSVQVGPRVPIPPSIELVGRQPVTIENRDIRIGLLNTLSNKLEWGGELKELKYLSITPVNEIEEYVNINEERCLGFNGNKLSSKLIKQINEGIANYCYGDVKNEEECINFRDNLVFSCGIRINIAPEGNLLDTYKIKTDVIYTYRVTKDASVQIRKREDTLFANLDRDFDRVTTNAIFFTENLLKKLPSS